MASVHSGAKIPSIQLWTYTFLRGINQPEFYRLYYSYSIGDLQTGGQYWSRPGSGFFSLLIKSRENSIISLACLVLALVIVFMIGREAYTTPGLALNLHRL